MRKKIVFSLGILVLFILLQGISFLVLLTQIRSASAQLDEANTMTTDVNYIKAQHYSWLYSLLLAVDDGEEFTGSLDPSSCSLGDWLASENVKGNSNPAFQALISDLYAPHNAIHTSAATILDMLAAGDQPAAEDFFHREVIPNLEKTVATLDEIDTHAIAVMEEKSAHSDALMLLSIALVIGLIVLSLIVGIVMILMMIKRVVPPLHQLTAAADGLAKGDVNIDVSFSSNDELGDLAEAFRGMAGGIREQAVVLSKISEGDYTAGIPVRSDMDITNQAINNMVEHNNSIMLEIREAANFVAASAANISEGSQVLATGSTQQAASLQQLSAAIAGIRQQAVSNNALATETAAEVNEAGQLMDKSLEYMDQMGNAMKIIDESSQSIAKVIKVIDDIAFQTNILALNAAVEAARAGIHGKGFAVVAEEVRSLAAKSAEAAQETAALIESSVRNVAHGAGVASKTGESLHQVGVISSNNAVAMGKMSEASSQQTAAINEVNIGVEEIAKVVQANSATAQQSAASAQELNAQSELLAKIVSRFTLRAPAEKEPAAQRYLPM